MKSMKRKLAIAHAFGFMLVSSFLATPSPVQATPQVGVVGSVSFTGTSATLSTNAKATLDGWKQTLDQATDIKVTGNYLAPASKPSVGTNRANSVVAYLQTIGLTANFTKLSKSGSKAIAVIEIVKLKPLDTGNTSLLVKIRSSLIFGMCDYTQVRLRVGEKTASQTLKSATIDGFSYCQATFDFSNVIVGTYQPVLTIQWPGGTLYPFVVKDDTWFLGTTTNDSVRLHSKASITVSKDLTTTIPNLEISASSESPIQPDPTYSASSGKVQMEIRFETGIVGTKNCDNLAGQLILNGEIASYAMSALKKVNKTFYCSSTVKFNQMPPGTYSATVFAWYTSDVASTASKINTADKNWKISKSEAYSKTLTSSVKVVVKKGSTTIVPTLLLNK